MNKEKLEDEIDNLKHSLSIYVAINCEYLKELEELKIECDCRAVIINDRDGVIKELRKDLFKVDNF